MKKTSINKAFSLIELSIVILIIGILVAGVTQSSRLVRMFKISTAQTLTQSSPVNGINNLMVWYETTLDASFNASEDFDKGSISAWYDINVQSTSKINACQNTAITTANCTATGSSASQPKYIENAINGLPVIQFDGNDDYLDFNGTGLIGTDYTIFVVEQRRSAPANYTFLIGTGNTGTSGPGSTFMLGFNPASGQNNFFHSLGGGGTYEIIYNIGSYISPKPRIHTTILNTSVGQSYWLNGGTTPEIATTGSGNKTPLALASLMSIARGNDGVIRYYQGDIAEIIIFTRALKTEERQSIESYLGKKYAITIS